MNSPFFSFIQIVICFFFSFILLCSTAARHFSASLLPGFSALSLQPLVVHGPLTRPILGHARPMASLSQCVINVSTGLQKRKEGQKKATVFPYRTCRCLLKFVISVKDRYRMR
ncbi:hypothetical protein V8C34DRAFT_273593 [Trichoderma compactum]